MTRKQKIVTRLSSNFESKIVSTTKKILQFPFQILSLSFKQFEEKKRKQTKGAPGGNVCVDANGGVYDFNTLDVKDRLAGGQVIYSCISCMCLLFK